MRIDHIGYAVQDLQAATAAFLDMGYRPCGDAVEDRGRNVAIRFLCDPAGVRVELIAPLGEDSPVSAWLRKNGNSPYHICYESEKLAADVAALKKKGFMVVQPSLPAPAMEDRNVCFMYNRNTGLIELVETAGSNVP